MIKVKALVNSRVNRMFADSLLLEIFICVLLPGDEELVNGDLLLPSYTAGKGFAPVRNEVTARELLAINDAIREARRIEFANTSQLMEWAKETFGLSDCQCVIAIQNIHWDNNFYRHNRK